MPMRLVLAVSYRSFARLVGRMLVRFARIAVQPPVQQVALRATDVVLAVVTAREVAIDIPYAAVVAPAAITLAASLNVADTPVAEFVVASMCAPTVAVVLYVLLEPVPALRMATTIVRVLLLSFVALCILVHILVKHRGLRLACHADI